jgi:oligopeptide transport system ATP-binding protein
MEKSESVTIDPTQEVAAVPADKTVALSVRNLAISFRTDDGYVRAVRGVSFDLYKGETLCIVGESGSGKSVTSKTIMGILSKNAHIDSGSVVYEGEDLTKIAEDDFHRIRGNKIGMIFQDPLSSLNPIMKIGRQITEVMVINGNHAKKIFEDAISPELIRYKNELRKIESAKDEMKLVNEHRQSTSAQKAAAKKAYLDVKNECTPLIKQYGAELKAAKKVARSKVRDFKRAARKEHHEKQTPLLRGIFSFKNFKTNWTGLLEERRRYVRVLRVTHAEAKQRALDVMKEVGIPEPERRFKQYPFEFSGGMRQRIVIAIALTADPDILICDEPTTALDVTIQAQILELINQLKASRHMSVIFITHDLGVVANMADRVAVMYAGKIVEYGTANEIFYHPAHPYTWALLSSIPDIDSKERLEAIPGTPPNMLYPPKGDAFAARSKYAMGIDFQKEPPMFKISDTHYAATWLLDSRAPKAVMPKIVSTRITNSLRKAGVKNV